MILNKAAISSERVCWWPIKHTVYKQHAFLDMNMVVSDFIEGLSFLSTHLDVHIKNLSHHSLIWFNWSYVIF